MNPVQRRIMCVVPTLMGGGAERVIVTILRHLDRSRFRSTLAVVNNRNAVFLQDVPADVEVIDLHCSRVRYVLPKLVKLIWKNRPDVVLSTLGYLNLALAMARPLLPRSVRYIARETVVLTSDLETKTWAWLWRAAYRLFYHRFDTIICQSRDMQQDIVQHFAVPRAKTIVIHNPVDLLRIRQLANECLDHDGGKDDGAACLRLVGVGRLTYQKGFDMLIDAIALSAQPALHVTILGEGPLRQQLEQRACEKGVAHQVRFVGFRRNPYPYLARADAFVLSSRFEGFPNVVLESLACRTPVIALPAPGGVKEILDGVKGCVVAQDISAESLARAIDSFCIGTSIDDHIMERYAAETITRRYEQELTVQAGHR